MFTRRLGARRDNGGSQGSPVGYCLLESLVYKVDILRHQKNLVSFSSQDQSLTLKSALMEQQMAYGLPKELFVH